MVCVDVIVGALVISGLFGVDFFSFAGCLFIVWWLLFVWGFCVWLVSDVLFSMLYGVAS